MIPTQPSIDSALKWPDSQPYFDPIFHVIFQCAGKYVMCSCDRFPSLRTSHLIGGFGFYPWGKALFVASQHKLAPRSNGDQASHVSTIRTPRYLLYALDRLCLKPTRATKPRQIPLQMDAYRIDQRLYVLLGSADYVQYARIGRFTGITWPEWPFVHLTMFTDSNAAAGGPNDVPA
jgi:hypothetical protein